MFLIDNCVITNIEVANIVCDVKKLADIMVINALWKTCGHRVIRRQTFDIVIFNVLWKTCDHRVIRQQTFEIVCGMENLLHCVYCGNLRVTV